MRIVLLSTLFFICAGLTRAQSQQLTNNRTHWLDTTQVSLKGKNAATTIKNSTHDTLKLKAKIDYYLPVSEKTVNLTIPPGISKSFQVKLYYADFIRFDNLPLQVFAAPGKNALVDIESTNPFKVSFTCDLASENTYYESYFKTAKNNSVYYQEGARLRDFNRFPQIADSVNRINTNYLDTYIKPLSPGFKKYERQRLAYNNAFLKYHVPFDKEFRSGSPVKLAADYFGFADSDALTGNLALSTEYLWYAIFNLRQKALQINNDQTKLTDGMLHLAETIFKDDELGDAVKMRLLYDAYASSKTTYQALRNRTGFINAENAAVLDSVINSKSLLSQIGKKFPALKFINLDNDTITLAQFAGHTLIINFWASWCTPCIKEFPSENRIAAEIGKANGPVVINICVGSKPADWKQLSAKHNLQMINLYADAKVYEALKRQFDLYSLPRSILVGKDEKIMDSNFKRVSLLKEADLNALR